MKDGTPIFYVYPYCREHKVEVDLNTGCSKCGYDNLEARVYRTTYTPNQEMNMKYVFVNEEDAKVAKANLQFKINTKKAIRS
jgi:disulfide oxidoreductase YuzD